MDAPVDTEPTLDMADLEQQARQAATLLRMLGNESRLLVLCHIVGAGEMSVGALAELVGLSQPALSQHLAKMREEGLLATRREAQSVYYRLADEKAARLLRLMRQLYCGPDA